MSPIKEHAVRKKPCAAPAATLPARTMTIPQSAQVMDYSELERDFAAGQAAEGLHIFCLRALDNVIRKRRRRRLLVPANGFQVVAHELLIERGLSAARLPRGAIPEARRIRRQHLVGKDRAFLRSAEFEFRIGEDQAAGLGVSGG